MKLIYIAGAFSAPTRDGVEANIRAAELVGIEVAKIGAYPVVPHANTSHPLYETVQNYQFWIDATMAMLCMCEALMLVPGWEQSSGARGEVHAAQERGMPVFQPGDYEGLGWWLRGSAETLPPPVDDRAVPIAEAKRMVAMGEMPAAVSFEGVAESRTRCELPTLNGEEER